ncbi:MAG TPA: transposase [bacterium]|nr:transposase [bacterium]
MVAEDHTLLKLLALVDELYEEEEETPRPRGRPLDYNELVMLKVFIVMVLKRIKHFKTLHRFLGQNPAIRQACGLPSLPDRRTFGRRLKFFPPGARKPDSELGREAVGGRSKRRDGGGRGQVDA